MKRLIFLAFFFLFILFFSLRSVSAVACGDTITEDTTLTQNLSCFGNGLIITGDDIVLDCNGHSIQGDSTGNDIGIFTASFRVIIINCEVSNFNTGIRADPLATVSNNTINNNGVGIDIFGDRNTASDNIITNNGIGIKMIATTLSAEILRNHFSGNGDAILGFGWISKIIGNTIFDNGGGIKIFEASSNILVINNTIIDNGGGIVIDGSSAGGFNDDANVQIISGNVIARSGGGIFVFGGEFGTLGSREIHGNIILNNTATGITLQAVNNANLSNNIISGNVNGIQILNSVNNTIWNNTLIDNGLNSFEDQPSNLNNWNMTNTGNCWSDLKSNPGFPNYEISGPGLGIDFHPSLCTSVPHIPNAPPILFPIGNQEVNEFEVLSIQLTASDPENETLSFGVSAPDLPSPFFFNSETGQFIWQPNYNSAGSYSATFTVSDGVYFINEGITINVIESCPEDIDGNGIVNVVDLIILLLSFGTNDPVPDVNNDGVVNVLDLIDVLLAFGQTCPTGFASESASGDIPQVAETVIRDFMGDKFFEEVKRRFNQGDSVLLDSLVERERLSTYI